MAVINHGHLEQVGTPAELYDEPVNDFVLTFVGPATSIGGALRPAPRRDDQSADPLPGSHPATVLRVVHLGFEVRVELRLDSDGDGRGRSPGPSSTGTAPGSLDLRPPATGCTWSRDEPDRTPPAGPGPDAVGEPAAVG